jgi:hypothetical protein
MAGLSIQLGRYDTEYGCSGEGSLLFAAGRQSCIDHDAAHFMSPPLSHTSCANFVMFNSDRGRRFAASIARYDAEITAHASSW